MKMNPLCIDLYGNNDVFLKISQYDKNYPITIILLNYTYKSGDIVKIDWCMNKETSIVQASNITQIDNTITFKLPREVALDGGEGTFNIVIENPNDDTRKSTFKIRTMIEYDSVNENTVSSILVETIIEDLKKEENNAQNKLDLLNEAIDKADLGKHNLVSYTDLSQLGLTKGSETLIQIITAMTDGSYLQLSIDSSYNSSQYPNLQGTLIINKANINRISIKYMFATGVIATNTYHDGSGFSGWNKLANENTITQAQKDTINMIYPIGESRITLTNTNPSTQFAWQTWVQIAQGQTLVGVGTGTDANNVEKTFVEGSNNGEYKHTQTIEELAQHNHTQQLGGALTTSAKTSGAAIVGTANNDTTGSTGGGQAFNICTPSFGIYIWKRTA